MKIKGFLDTSFLDWPGKLAAVVFLPGCNFRCPFCHNHELVFGGGGLPDIPVDYVLRRLDGLRGWVDAVVVSGGEPTIHRGLPGLLKQFRDARLAVKLDTNGSRPEMVRHLVEEGLVQAVDMDLKAPLQGDAYRRLAGVDVDVEKIRATIDLLETSGLPHRFRMTYVPALLDGTQVREAALEAGADAAFTLQAFDPRRALDPLLRETAPPTPEEMDSLRQAAAAAVAV